MTSSTNRILTVWVLVVGSIGLASPFGAAADIAFVEPQLLTDGAQQYQLSRNPNSAMAFDSTGALHIAYWSGSFATSPAEPSYIYYQSWTEAGGWTSRESIDDSYYDNGGSPLKYGGRHPSLTIATDDTVWVAWHDLRHCNPLPPGNGTDNIEIYADRKPADGAFSATDLRLTTTSTAHLGDNGYGARIVSRPTGELSVLWYDFHAEAGLSDLYAKHSDGSGAFNLAESIGSMRLTDVAQRDPMTPYTVPDFATDSTGRMFAIWTSDLGGAAPIYFAEVSDPAAPVAETMIAPNAGGFFDPAKITVAHNDDLWVAYTSLVSTERDIHAMRRPAGSTMWDAPIPLSAAAGVREEAVDLELAQDGTLHVVWIDERDGRHVYYGQYDPAARSFTESQAVTADPGQYTRATLTLDDADRPHIVFERSTGVFSGDIYFVAPDPDATEQAPAGIVIR